MVAMVEHVMVEIAMVNIVVEVDNVEVVAHKGAGTKRGTVVLMETC
jgi:hypothetical protein